MAKPIDLSLKSTWLFQICNNHSYKKVQTIGVFLIVSSIAVLALSVYFCAATRSFTNAKVIAFTVTAIPLLAVGIIFLKMRSSLLTLLETYDVEFSAENRDNWNITVSEWNKIAQESQIREIREGISDVTDLIEFANLCNQFNPKKHFKNNMSRIFSIVDPTGDVQTKLRGIALECILTHGFAELAKEFQMLEWRINWSFLNLFDIKKQKEFLMEYLDKNNAKEDFEFMCFHYPDIAKRLLPVEVLQTIDIRLRLEDPDLLWRNWNIYKSGEKQPKLVL